MDTQVVRRWGIVFTRPPAAWPDTPQHYGRAVLRPDEVSIEIIREPGAGPEVAGAIVAGRRVLKTGVSDQQICASYSSGRGGRLLASNAPDWVERLAAGAMEAVRDELALLKAGNGGI